MAVRQSSSYLTSSVLLLVVVFAVFSAWASPTQAASPDDGFLPRKASDTLPTKHDMEMISSHLASLTSPETMRRLAMQIDPTGTSVDPAFLQSALRSLYSLLSSADGQAIIMSLQNDPEQALSVLSNIDDGGSNEPLSSAISYFSSLRDVLHSNAHLRQQVAELIRKSSETLLVENDLSSVFSSIVNSQVLKDLKDEVEDEIGVKSGSTTASEADGAMSR